MPRRFFSPDSPFVLAQQRARKLATPLTTAALSASLVLGGAGSAFAAPAPNTPEPQLPASSGPADCVPFVGDPVKGYGQFPLGLVAPDYGHEGIEKLVTAKRTDLPEAVHLRDNHQGFNSQLEMVLRDGSLYVRMFSDKTWREVPMPSCLKGKIVSMSLNDDDVIAVDKAGWMYTLSNLLSSPDRWGWIRAWGGPFWFGGGQQSPNTGEGKWALSLIGNHTDKTYLDPSGKQQPVSLAKCTQVVALSQDGTRIYSLDPWLANDYSYEIGTPLDSRLIVESITASGSVVFVTNKFGDMYTIQSDYDSNGSDPAQFRYTWQNDDRPAAEDALQHRLDPRSAPIKLPPNDWFHQPKIPGTITGRISLHSTAPGSQNREMRVEGVHNGQTGYWYKALTAQSWKFRATGEKLQGKVLQNSMQDRSKDTLRAPSPYNYQGELVKGVHLRVDHFAYASVTRPVTLTVAGKRYTVLLHSIDGRLGTPLTMRAQPGEGQFAARPAGLDSKVERNYVAAIEFPQEVWAQAQKDKALAAFIRSYMAGQRVHEIYLRVTTGTMKVVNSPVQGIAAPLVSTVSPLRAF